MTKDFLMRSLAENGYNVSFGARKHFATYDIVEKIPGFIALISLLIGVWQVYLPKYQYSTEVSLGLIFLSIIALSITLYNSEKDKYKDVGSQLVNLHNRLKNLYYNVQGSNGTDFTSEEAEMEQIMNSYYSLSISKQILMSDWYAHYKFFFQVQHEWINEQKSFTWRDKIPLSFRFAIILVVILLIVCVVWGA
ncbi:SLATT domain-containing protein [Paenibacillus sp. BC26]|uniref:SLATT domain-containing protein n=1 Tax=Paenibacillus sp. BC26 TaxID=1881032 RepID=UPI0008E739FC|nr:SLATT domain-containing protein [Paenibacillus sp. BC26]SFS83904.1 hypothetical protein SAMN05428962_3170 [Paenibacillus sp. BC26]